MTEHDSDTPQPPRPKGHGELRRVVAANIRYQRVRRGWSLDNVAKRLAPYLGRMGASTISSWENTRNSGAKGFTVDELYGLCKVYRLTFAELLSAPELLDMERPIEQMPGEDAFEDLAALFTKADHERQLASWRRYEDGITEEEQYEMIESAKSAEIQMIEDGEHPYRPEDE